MLLNALTALSLLLLVATAVLWVRSYRLVDYPKYQLDRGTAAMYSSRGGVRLSYATATELNPGLTWDRLKGLSYYPLNDTAHPFWNRLGIGVDSGQSYASGNTVASRYWGITLPHWLIAAAMVLPPLARAVGCYRRRRRSVPGLCTKCGYDLRATPDRCPECGQETELSVQSWTF
jgi:hypothetical protein